MVENTNTGNWVSIDRFQPAFDQVESHLRTAYEFVKSFPQRAQDPNVAYLGLIAMNLFAFELAKLTTGLFDYFVPHNQNASIDENFRRARIGTVIGFGTIVVALKIFLDMTKLPVPIEKVLPLSIGVIGVRAYLYSRNT